MANILLIDTNTTPFNETFPVYPTGLDYLQSAISDAGLGMPQIVDLTRMGGPLHMFDPDERKRRSLLLIKESIDIKDWDVIGLSLRNIDSTYPVGKGNKNLHYYLPDLMDYIECADRIKAKETFLILGGTAFSIMPEIFMEGLSERCYGTTGPAEHSLTRLVEDLLNNVPCPRITKGERHSIGKLRNGDLIREYMRMPSNENTFGIRTRIGCGQRCGYCPYPLINGPGHTLKHVDDILEEIHLITDLREEVDSSRKVSIMFADDIFNRPLGHAKDILYGLLESDMPVDSWHAYLDPKSMDREFIELVLETGGWSGRVNGPGKKREYFFPLDIESGSPRILKELHKPYGVEDIKRSAEIYIKAANHYGKRPNIAAIRLGFHVLLGYPGENEESIKETCDLINEIRPSNIAFQLGVRIYPGTWLAKETKGRLWHNDSDLIEPLVTDMDQKKVVKWLDSYLSQVYTRINTKGNMITVSQD